MHGWFKIIDLGLVYSTLLLAVVYVLRRLISPQICANKPRAKTDIILGANLVKGLNLANQRMLKNIKHKPIVSSN